MKLQNKIAVITGGNSGIGLAAAHELTQQGTRVIIIGRNTDAVAKAAKDVGGNTLGLVADVSKIADLDRVFQAIRERAGQIDILFANAGIAEFAPWRNPPRRCSWKPSPPTSKALSSRCNAPCRC